MALKNELKTSTAVGLSETESPVKSPVDVPALSMRRAEELFDALEATKTRAGLIQGFYASTAKVHYIRDVALPWEEQRIWESAPDGEGEYEATHAEMVRQIEIRRLQLAITFIESTKAA